MLPTNSSEGRLLREDRDQHAPRGRRAQVSGPFGLNSMSAVDAKSREGRIARRDMRSAASDRIRAARWPLGREAVQFSSIKVDTSKLRVDVARCGEGKRRRPGGERCVALRCPASTRGNSRASTFQPQTRTQSRGHVLPLSDDPSRLVARLVPCFAACPPSSTGDGTGWAKLVQLLPRPLSYTSSAAAAVALRPTAAQAKRPNVCQYRAQLSGACATPVISRDT